MWLTALHDRKRTYTGRERAMNHSLKKELTNRTQDQTRMWNCNPIWENLSIFDESGQASFLKAQTEAM